MRWRKDSMGDAEEPKITRILEYLDEAPNTYTSATRIKKKLENVPQHDNVSARDYGQKLSSMRLLGLVEQNGKRRRGWRITDLGQKWKNGELDPREL